jgi:preprotein translocase subunit SecY
MPVIFAQTILQFPMVVSYLLASRLPIIKPFIEAFYQGPLFWIAQFLLIIILSFFYTALAINPPELAENMRKSGGFIPGKRPGKQTADYFDYILYRIGLAGAIYLATLALLPNILRLVFGIPFEENGTSMLIAVGVALEIANQVESYLIERRYDGFLSGGRIKNRA